MADSLEASIAGVEKAMAQGDWLKAFDLAREAIERHPDSETLKHKGLLALADARATDRARWYFREWKLDRSENADFLALEARLAKDAGSKLTGDARHAAFLESADGYRRLSERDAAYYLKLNWATMSFLGGAKDKAVRLANDVLADPEVVAGKDYWALVTRAEAKLLIGNDEAARDDLAAAAPLGGARNKMRTRKQLRLILAERGFSPAATSELLKPLSLPITLHYVGVARAGEGWSSLAARGALAQAEERIRETIARLRPGAVFGSLGSPAEIIFAEEALASGADLKVVLPFPQDSFREHFLAGAGAGWAKRFDRCCGHERTQVSFAADDPFADDPSLIEYAERIAMGRALLQAQDLDGDAAQIVLTDTSHPADVELAASSEWVAGTRRRQEFVALLDTPPAKPVKPQRREARPSCAVVFGDLPGFSKLPEKYLPKFWETVMKAIGDVVTESGDTVALKNTWGDAIHFVIPDVRKAAEVCLAVQKRLTRLDGKDLGRDEPPTMRIGAHYGPVFRGFDPIVGSNTFFGRALSRAARIEPITPPGAVYVTEAFAAILLLESRDEFACTYVGQVPLAKGFGTFRMYDLIAKPEAIQAA